MALNPILPIAGLGALLLLLTSKKSNASTFPEGQGGPPLGTPSPGSANNAPAASNAPRPTNELSDAQRERMAEALGRLGVSPATGKLSGAADADAIRFASQVVGELDAAGFKDAAQALRTYVDEASKAVQTPAAAAPVAAAAQAAGMTPEQAAYAARLLSLERDPNKIGLFIDWLKKLAPSPQRDTFIQMAQALQLQLAAANITTDTLDKINQVITQSPELPDEEEQSGPAPSLPTQQPVYTSTSPGVPQKPVTSSTPPKPLPEKPVVVPSQPVPQTVPVPLTDGEIVARSVVANLLATQNKFGVKAAKGKEDKALVKKFQSIVGITQDGSAGPATYILLAGKGAVNLPLVYYWPKTATAATVAEYRSSLEKIAQKLEEVGRRDEANTLRVSIAREHGEGGINGALFGAPAAAAKPVAAKPVATAPKPAAAPAAPPAATNAGVDPYPGQRTLMQGMKGDDVKRWQQALLSGADDVYGTHNGQVTIYDIGTADGDFGPKTTTMTEAFQKDAKIDADGKVGSGTRIAARKLGMW